MLEQTFSQRGLNCFNISFFLYVSYICLLKVLCLIGDSTALCVALGQIKKRKAMRAATNISTTEDLTLGNCSNI